MYTIRDKWTPEELAIKDDINDFRDAFLNGGISTKTGAAMSIADAVSTPNAPLMFKRVITEVIQEAIEPNLIGASLLSRIDFNGYGTQISFGTLGGIGGASLDMAEGQEYPEFGIQAGNGTVTANIGKVGIALKITEEMIKYSQWDVIALHLRQAGRAMARHKERKIFDMLNASGVVIFDNTTPANAEIGLTGGRGRDGTGNGSLSADDLFDMYAKTVERGFSPDTILVHPLTWAIWLKDPVLREWAMLGVAGGNMYNGPNGSLNGATSAVWKALGRSQGPSISATPEERQGTQTSTPVLPSYLPFAGSVRIIPSPMVPYDSNAQTCSIIMLDSRELGAIVVSEDPMTEQWKDPSTDIHKVKIRERYGLVLFNEGEAVSVAKNVALEPNYLINDGYRAQATLAEVEDIDRKP